jgi:hypothetical protein
MSTNENLIEVLNDLVQINNDRIEGYERAIKETDDIDVDLQGLFQKMANESRGYLSELSSVITSLGGEVATGTTNSGKIYRVWMDVKAGEDAAQEAYADALASDAEIPANVRQLITDQKASLLNSHDLIKKYRDAHKAVNNL